MGSNYIGNKGCMEIGGVGYMKNAMGIAVTTKKIGDYLSGAAARTGSGNKEEEEKYLEIRKQGAWENTKDINITATLKNVDYRLMQISYVWGQLLTSIRDIKDCYYGL